jgi:hypothetical protein
MPRARILVFRDGPGGTAPFLEWLDALKKPERKAYAKCLAYLQHLEREGYELDRPIKGTLRDGIHELRPSIKSVNYRILNFFCERNTPCISHGLKKERIVPDVEIDRALKRIALVLKNRSHYTHDWEFPK